MLKWIPFVMFLVGMVIFWFLCYRLTMQLVAMATEDFPAAWDGLLIFVGELGRAWRGQ